MFTYLFDFLVLELYKDYDFLDNFEELVLVDRVSFNSNVKFDLSVNDLI